MKQRLTTILKKLAPIMVIALLSFSNVGSLLALSEEQRRVIDSDVYYFNVEETRFICNTGTPLVGSDNAERVWNYFIAKPLAPHLVAGILGNLAWESGINPLRVQGTRTPEGDSQDPNAAGSLGWGIMQWTPGSKIIGLMETAGITTPVYELSSQLDLVWWHLNNVSPTGRQNVIEGFKQQTTVDAATDYFEEYMEGAGVPRLEERRAIANDYFAQFGSSTSSTNSGSSACAVTGGQVVGNYSLPVDRRWYDEHPDWFTKPHHDRPAADIPVPTGTAVYSMSAGRVINAPNGGDCGDGVTIDAGNGVLFIYCHGLDGGSVLYAQEGDVVTPGQLIMSSDNTGHSTGPHLHVGIRINNEDRCPQSLFMGIVNGAPPDVMSLPSSGCTYDSGGAL